MAKIIHEKYENGVLVERVIEAAGSRPLRVIRLLLHLLVALSLVVLAITAVHDSLLLGEAAATGDSSEASCQQPRYQS